MAYKLLDAAQDRWRKVTEDVPFLVELEWRPPVVVHCCIRL
jgi:hypothetical protein